MQDAVNTVYPIFVVKCPELSVSKDDKRGPRHSMIITAVQILPDDIDHIRCLDTKRRPVSIVPKVNAEGHYLIVQTSSISSI